MASHTIRPKGEFLAIQARIDSDPAYRARFLADPPGTVAAEGIPTDDLRLAGSDDPPEPDEVTGHTIRIGRYLCVCILHDSNGACVIEECLIP